MNSQTMHVSIKTLDGVYFEMTVKHPSYTRYAMISNVHTMAKVLLHSQPFNENSKEEEVDAICSGNTYGYLRIPQPILDELTWWGGDLPAQATEEAA